MKDRVVAIGLPSWDPNEPRFVKEVCPQCSVDVRFADGSCVFNQRLGLAYSVDEIVDVLNNLGGSIRREMIIRDLYLEIKKNFSEETLFSKGQVLAILGCIAEELEIDLKEYPKLNINDILGEMSNGR